METPPTILSPEDSITVSPLKNVPLDHPRPEAFEIMWLKNQPPPDRVSPDRVSPDRVSPDRVSSRWETADRQLRVASQPCLGDCLYLLPPGKEYPLDWFGREGVLIRFHRDVLHYEVNEFSMEVYQLFTQQENFSVLFVEKPVTKTLDQVYQLLEEEYTGDRHFLLLRTLLKVFLLKLVCHQSHRFIEQDFDQKRVHQFLHLLEQHYAEEKNVAFYADHLNITPKRLNQILKHKMDRTIGQCLHERLVAEAKHQLIISERTIKEVATQLGFEDHSYFSRFFKKMTGHTPEAYQRKAQARIALTT